MVSQPILPQVSLVENSYDNSIFLTEYIQNRG